jgi:nicotinate phosphoribosyltransferase
MSDLSEGALFTDQYQLAMAQVYFREGIHERRSRFDYFFRSYPDYGRHQAGYCVFAGLETLFDWMERATFGPSEIEALSAQRTSAGEPRFAPDFLEWLEANGHFGDIEIRTPPEGRVVHALAPVAVIDGPLAMAQILETSLLNHLNFETLIATKASRIAEAGRNNPVLEFGMRRGHGKGVNAGARAALIGGAAFTSNVGMSHLLGLDPKGTHAHSLVQAFISFGAGELEAFRAFARVYPDDCILLVDTIDTLGTGVPNAITVFGELRAAGHEPLGIRLDSGDLAYLAIQASRRLDEAGFGDVSIVLSNNLDELHIWQILAQIEEEAPGYGVDPVALGARLVYGVGTRLITSAGHGALDGVCKLVAIESDGALVPSTKVSNSPEKQPIPGDKEVWRLYDRRGNATVDVVAAPGEAVDGDLELFHPHRQAISRTLSAEEVSAAELLLDVSWNGGRHRPRGSIGAARDHRARDLARLDPGVRRIVDPHIYHVSVTRVIHDLQLASRRAAQAS